MTAAAHVFPNIDQLALTQSTATKLNSDTLKVGLATGTFNWPGTSDSTANYTTVAQFLANAGTGGGGALTEVSVTSTGYSRQALTGVSLTTSATSAVTTLTCANPSWTCATVGFSASYAFFYDANVDTSDSTRLLLCYWDFGGSSSVTPGGTFTLTVNASGLATWTCS